MSTATTERSDHTRLGFRTLLDHGRMRGATPGHRRVRGRAHPAYDSGRSRWGSETTVLLG
ncbi:hypothetical protein [Streptomyces violaceusniger]|uniref:hypothetical protein n=1 Tax=Streptomyces violaceusniger TaxID=68280 RepID=UPI0012372DEB|nr:hypothetical protein [Streptomyces violaceusniger]